MFRLTFWFILLIVCAPGLNSLHADVIISVGDTTLTPGGTGFVDVSIESTSTDDLQAFGFQFNITTGGATRLEFVNPQLDLQLTDSDYVFFGDSFSLINVVPVGAVSTSFVPNDTFIGGDLTDSFADVPLTISKLLARLQVTSITALPPGLGDSFTVTFDDTSFNTFFFDSFSTPLTINTALSDFTGTVTIASAAIPEPSSISLLLMGLVGCGVRIRQKRRV